MPAQDHKEMRTSSQSLSLPLSRLLVGLLLLMVGGTLLLTLAGCSQETGNEPESEAPTATGVAFLVTEEVSETPLPSNTVTQTPQPSATELPTASKTPLPSHTATETPKPSATQRPTDTPIPTQTATQRPTETPIPTETPTYQPVLAGTPVPALRQAQGPAVVTIGAQNADEIRQLAYFGNGLIKEVVVSKGGNLLAVASSIGVFLYDTQTFEQVGFIDTKDTKSKVERVAISDDGQHVASIPYGNMVHLWSADGTLIKILEGHTDRVERIAFSPDGKMLASVSKDRTMRLWSIDGTLLHKLPGLQGTVWDVAFSPDGQIVAAAAGQTVYLWSADGTPLATVKGFVPEFANSVSMAFSPDSKTLASASREDTRAVWSKVRLWSIDGTLLREFSGHIHDVNSVVFSPDGSLVASGSSGRATRTNRVFLWSTDGTLIKELEGHEDHVTSMAFSPDGSRLASLSYNNTVYLWDKDGMLIKALEGHRYDINSIAFTPDSNTLISASSDAVYLWSMDGTFKGELSQYTSLPNATELSTASKTPTGTPTAPQPSATPLPTATETPEPEGLYSFSAGFQPRVWGRRLFCSCST